MPRDSISACLVVRHEEAVIERCLKSLEGAVDEIVLVHDGPCLDGTLDIARRHGARVFERPLAGHGEAHRPFAYEQARGEWLLRIDADEFLSDGLRAALRALATRPDVNGYEVIWPIWSRGAYAASADGPWRLVFMRRSATHLLGMIQESERVDGRVERVSLILEHQPVNESWALRTMLAKWPRWARIHAEELTGPFSALPRFNYPESDWTWRRKLLNWVGPPLFLPYGLAMFGFTLWRQRGIWRDSFRFRAAFAQAFYTTLVQVYVGQCQIRRLRDHLR